MRALARSTGLVLAFTALVSGTVACGDSAQAPEPSGATNIHRSPADSSRFPSTLTSRRETDPVPHGDDAADDPAIWVNRAKPAHSAIVGTDKRGGIAVYDLAGRQIQYRPDGEINNVDLRDGFPLGGRRVTLVTAGNRSDNTIAIYHLDAAKRTLRPIAAGAIHPGIETYGSCMYRSPVSRKTYYFVTSEAGPVEQWELFDDGRGRVDARKVRSLRVETQTEGCVADDQLARLYVGEEARGIWSFGAEPGAGNRRVLVDSTGDGGHLTADVEGLAIAYGSGGDRSGGGGHLVASSQGSSSFVVYRRAGGNRYEGTFEVRTGNGIDAVDGTDGIDVTTTDLGPPFQRGLFVAQDDRNDSGHQNYKLVPWR